MEMEPGKKPFGRKRFRRGDAVKNMNDLFSILAAERWVYWRDVPKHPSVVRNFSLTTLIGGVSRGNVFIAVENNPTQGETE